MPFPALKIANRRPELVDALVGKLMDWGMNEQASKDRIEGEKELYSWKKQQDLENPDPKTAGLPQLETLLRNKSAQIESAMMESLYQVNPKRTKELQKLQGEFDTVADMVKEKRQKMMQEESDRELKNALTTARTEKETATTDLIKNFGPQQKKTDIDLQRARIDKLKADAARDAEGDPGKKIDLIDKIATVQKQTYSYTDTLGVVGAYARSKNLLQSPEETKQILKDLAKKAANENQHRIDRMNEDKPGAGDAWIRQMIQNAIFGPADLGE